MSIWPMLGLGMLFTLTLAALWGLLVASLGWGELAGFLGGMLCPIPGFGLAMWIDLRRMG